MKNIMKYPTSQRKELRSEIVNCFKKGITLTDEKEIKKERKKAIIGLAHVFMYIEKKEELMVNYENTPTNYSSLNPKDEEFIYF